MAGKSLVSLLSLPDPSDHFVVSDVMLQDGNDEFGRVDAIVLALGADDDVVYSKTGMLTISFVELGVRTCCLSFYCVPAFRSDSAAFPLISQAVTVCHFILSV